MIRGIYTAASGMLAEKNRTDVIANNLANVNTAGFKKDWPVFQSFDEMLIYRLRDPNTTPATVTFPSTPYAFSKANPPVGNLGTGTALAATFTDFKPGPMRTTENPLDVALRGRGFFTIITPAGERYTRRGVFSIDQQGRLVSEDGYEVKGRQGAITVQGKIVSIDQQGNIIVDGKIVDALAIADFPDLTSLTKEGDNLFAAPTGLLPRPAAGVSLVTGAVEESNVNPISEMVNLITAMRAYEVNQRMVVAEDQLLDKAVNEVGRVV